MSTFNGIVEEFPQIRIDYFRKNPDRPPPLACFLSHVHSDHLQGLESLRAPFVYCSTTTREILLRIEKYPHRMNFSKGILESRKQHYKHLAKLLRPIPLQVPTDIELMPGNRIRVTLVDANHCPGAVMFLIEGKGKSILYTGDIRAEPWWVESLVRNPILIPYTLGTKRLDNIYLDTTFATKSSVYATFPSKAEGIRELLEKVQKYPEDTIFYLRSWTFGYEEVWLALSNALNSPIHVDQYQLGLYKSLASHASHGFGSNEGLYLCGFTLGNAHTRGCLTERQTVRIHSCELGDVCSTISSGKSVYITPIVTRTQEGSEVLEVGAGGGLGDLYQINELEFLDDASIQKLIDLCAEHIADPATREVVAAALSDAYTSKNKSLSLDDYGIRGEDEISLKELVQLLSRGPSSFISDHSNPKATQEKKLPNTIRFPYSRHSSYEELCSLVKAFKPKDIVPCTVDASTWREEVSMENLFGRFCSGDRFLHDEMMRKMIQDSDSQPRKRARRHSDSSVAQSTQNSSVAEAEHCDPSTSQTSSARREQSRRPSQRKDDEHTEKGTTIAMSQPATLAQRSGTQPSPSHLETSTQRSTRCDARAIRHAVKRRTQGNNRDHDHVHDHDQVHVQDPGVQFHLPTSTVPQSNVTAVDSQLSLRTIPERNESDTHPDSEPQHQRTSSALNASYEHDTEHDTEIDDNEDDVESTVTLSTSAFDSQSTTTPAQGANDENIGHPRPTLNTSHDDFEPTASHSSNSRAPSTSCRQKRMAAYRAARSGSFELWSSVYSPITAGNNHSEADVEL